MNLFRVLSIRSKTIIYIVLTLIVLAFSLTQIIVGFPALGKPEYHGTIIQLIPFILIGERLKNKKLYSFLIFANLTIAMAYASLIEGLHLSNILFLPLGFIIIFAILKPNQLLPKVNLKSK